MIFLRIRVNYGVTCSYAQIMKLQILQLAGNVYVGGEVVSALDSGQSGPGSSPGPGALAGRHCVVFLGKKLYSHGASINPGV